MLYDKRIDLIEAIDPSKSNNNNRLIICHNCYFDHGLQF